MRILCAAALLFVAFFVIHIILWKVRLPKNHTTALLKILALTLVVGATLAPLLGLSGWQNMHGALLFVSIGLSYVIVYSAIEGDSPTLSLMRFVGGQSAAGRSIEEIKAFFAERPFIRARIVALLNSSLIKEVDGRFVIAGKPSLPFRLLLTFRKIYGTIPKGG